MKAAIVGVAGTSLTSAEAALFERHPPAGVILFARNIDSPEQVGGLKASLPPDTLLLVDQEGGRVARLRPPHWRAHPPAAALVTERLAWLSGALIGLDCAAFDVVCAPVLDLRVPGAHDIVGDRSFGSDPARVAKLGRAFADGMMAAGVTPVMKHAPGHGRAAADSHLSLPRVDSAGLADDVRPFAANADLPWAMTAHIVYAPLDAARPATLSPVVIGTIIRDMIGFQGVLVSDDLAMHALDGPPEARALAALSAGCDLAAWCPGEPDGNARLLAACPEISAAALDRLSRARTFVTDRRQPLDGQALAAERDRLLA